MSDDKIRFVARPKEPRYQNWAGGPPSRYNRVYDTAKRSDRVSQRMAFVMYTLFFGTLIIASLIALVLH